MAIRDGLVRAIHKDATRHKPATEPFSLHERPAYSLVAYTPQLTFDIRKMFNKHLRINIYIYIYIYIYI